MATAQKPVANMIEFLDEGYKAVIRRRPIDINFGEFRLFMVGEEKEPTYALLHKKGEIFDIPTLKLLTTFLDSMFWYPLRRFHIGYTRQSESVEQIVHGFSNFVISESAFIAYEFRVKYVSESATPTKKGKAIVWQDSDGETRRTNGICFYTPEDEFEQYKAFGPHPRRFSGQTNKEIDEEEEMYEKVWKNNNLVSVNMMRGNPVGWLQTTYGDLVQDCASKNPKTPEPLRFGNEVNDFRYNLMRE